MSKVLDLAQTYDFIKRLTTPFEETEAYKLGIIDQNGKKIKNAVSRDEQDAYGYYDRMVFNIKKIIEKLPGGQSKLASYTAALFLIREQHNHDSEESLMEALEEEIGNSTGAGVAGTGDDQATWKDGRKKETKEFLRRYMESRKCRDEARKLKEKQEFLKKLGVVKEIG